MTYVILAEIARWEKTGEEGVEWLPVHAWLVGCYVPTSDEGKYDWLQIARYDKKIDAVCLIHYLNGGELEEAQSVGVVKGL